MHKALLWLAAAAFVAAVATAQADVKFGGGGKVGGFGPKMGGGGGGAVLPPNNPSDPVPVVF